MSAGPTYSRWEPKYPAPPKGTYNPQRYFALTLAAWYDDTRYSAPRQLQRELAYLEHAQEEIEHILAALDQNPDPIPTTNRLRHALRLNKAAQRLVRRRLRPMQVASLVAEYVEAITERDEQ